MSSLIEGYNYDIFISYRQKDNKHDGWVTEFVNQLKGELEATFKEEISVYFDINPHDGLLETHDVDESLKEKLKCLIFIPILSRTYCDPNSFAWEHEFRLFLELAAHDRYGLKVKLPNGNVGSRVLPVRIHDLEARDVKLFEETTGSPMRALDFVFRTSSGVNRPLGSKEDHPGDNLNKTFFQDQINKVALAIKEILNGLKGKSGDINIVKTQNEVIFDEPGVIQRSSTPPKNTLSRRLKWLSILIAAAVLVFAVISLYPKILKKNTLEKLWASGQRITVVVMPFQNMTNDTTWNIWQDGIRDILTASLSNSEELKVRQAESVTDLVRGQGIISNASITPSIASSISKKLDADIMIYGNIKQAGSTARLYAQIIDPETEEVYKSFQIEGLDREETIFPMIDSLSVIVKDFLILSELKKTLPSYYRNLITTSSPEAYRYFSQGRNLFAKSDFMGAVDWFLKAIALDSTFYQAIIMTSVAYWNQYEIEKVFSSTYDKLYLIEEAKKWCLRAYDKKDQMPIQLKINTNWAYANCFGTPYERIKYLMQLIEIDDQNPTVQFNIGNSYMELNQYEMAIPYYEKSLEIYDKWGIQPFWVLDYIYLGQSYQKNGQYKKAVRISREAEKYFPYDIELIGWQGILSAISGDTATSSRYFDKFVSTARAMNMSESTIESLFAFGCREAGMLDRAEDLYRKTLSLDPDNPDKINDLAFFLIDTDRDTKAGLDLVEQALKMVPEYFAYLDTKGWGLYKQRKYREALDLLQKSWDLRMEKAIYDHDAFLHLEAAKKAVAGL